MAAVMTDYCCGEFFETARHLCQRRKHSQRASPFRRCNVLLGDIRGLIEAAREQTACAVNSALVGMYWQIDKRIREDVLQNERAEYGNEILQTLSEELTEDYGRGFSRAKFVVHAAIRKGFPR